LPALVRKPKAQVGRDEKAGDFVDGVGDRRIVIGHERSPIETTHNDLRLAVAVWWASVNYIRRLLEKCPARIGQILSRVNQEPGRNWRRGETAFGKRWRRAWLAVQEGCGRNGETGNARNGGQLRTSGVAMPSTKSGKDVGEKGIGSSGRTRTYNPSVNSHHSGLGSRFREEGQPIDSVMLANPVARSDVIDSFVARVSEGCRLLRGEVTALRFGEVVELFLPVAWR
jgi:hypothetical protein